MEIESRSFETTTLPLDKPVVMFESAGEDMVTLVSTLYDFNFEYNTRVSYMSAGRKREDFMAHIKFSEVANNE